jgi:hypothetical protein
MTEKPPSGDEQSNGPSAINDPVTPPKTEVSPPKRANPAGSAHGSQNGRHQSEPSPRGFLRRLTINEWLTFLVGVGSLFVSYLTYKNAADTSDLKGAVQNLTNLAVDTTRQADASQEQLKVLKDNQRPWLGLAHIEALRGIIPSTDHYIPVDYRNFGRTPASHVKVVFNADVYRLGDAPTIPLPVCDDCGDGETIMPSMPVRRTPHIDGLHLTQPAIDQIKAGTSLIWLTGRIDYRDTDGKPHTTFLCEIFGADGSFRSCDVPDSNHAD